MEDLTTEDSYEVAKKKAKELYSKIGRVWCPALGDWVVFNSAGFDHLIWQGKTRRRKREQMRRFELLPYAALIIGSASQKFEYRQEERISMVKRKGIKTKAEAKVQFWGFSGVMHGRCIKVVVRQIGNSRKHFFSVFEEYKKSARI